MSKTSISITLRHWRNHCKEYVAKITGLHPKFGFDREFIRPINRDWSRSGKNGSTTFVVFEPGYYEIQEPATGVYGGKEARRWFKLETDKTEPVPIEESDVFAAFGDNSRKEAKLVEI